MSTYLIDFENVKSGGLSGIEFIKKEDSIHLFWSKRENKITIEMMELIRSSESEIVMHKAVTGERDALDHQLCSYLGFLAGGKGETDFVIVSNDKAYDHLIEFWKKMDHSIRIRRVPEISKVSELIKTPEVAVTAEPCPEDNIEKETDAGTADTETAFSEIRSSRNFRRRERGGKYLKGGRNSRNNWKTVYSEEHFEERTTDTQEEPAEKHVEPIVKAESVVKEEPVVKAEPIVKAESIVKEEPGKAFQEKYSNNRVSETVEEYGEKTPAKSYQQSKTPAAIVVTGIRTGIVVESGYTADGILDHRRTEESVAAKNAEQINDEKESENLSKMAAAKEPVKEIPVKTDAEESAKEKTIKEEPGKTVAEESAKEKTIKEEPGKVIVEETAKKESVETDVEETVKKESVETDVKASADSLKEDTSQPPVEKTGDTLTKTAEAENAEPVMEKTTAKGRNKRAAKETKKAAENASHPAGRAKRGRPPKKDRTEHVPEVKSPATEADVIAKCESAANAEWTGEVVRLINHSRDKKELYASIVRLLGQEKGRTVYHEIKVLK